MFLRQEQENQKRRPVVSSVSNIPCREVLRRDVGVGVFQQ